MFEVKYYRYFDIIKWKYKILKMHRQFMCKADTQHTHTHRETRTRTRSVSTSRNSKEKFFQPFPFSACRFFRASPPLSFADHAFIPLNSYRSSKRSTNNFLWLQCYYLVLRQLFSQNKYFLSQLFPSRSKIAFPLNNPSPLILSNQSACVFFLI